MRRWKNFAPGSGWKWSFPPCGTFWTGWDYRLKKTLHASEQQRKDVQEARAEWKENQLTLDPARLVFIDETWASHSVVAD
jgi:hypothetical protein